jgi:hypothetical protein
MQTASFTIDTSERNAQGCPIRGQTGDDAVISFQAILASLPAELRAAFEAERAERALEVSGVVAVHGYRT